MTETKKIPIIDERVKFIGATALRSLTAKMLRESKDVLVVQVEEKPVAVIVPFGIYLEIQKALWPASVIPALDGSAFVETTSVELFDDESRKEAGCLCGPGDSDPNCPLTNHRGRVVKDYVGPPSKLEAQGKEQSQAALCAHCSKPSDEPLCKDCFFAGHRTGECQKCREEVRDEQPA